MIDVVVAVVFLSTMGLAVPVLGYFVWQLIRQHVDGEKPDADT